MYLAAKFGNFIKASTAHNYKDGVSVGTMDDLVDLQEVFAEALKTYWDDILFAPVSKNDSKVFVLFKDGSSFFGGMYKLDEQQPRLLLIQLPLEGTLAEGLLPWSEIIGAEILGKKPPKRSMEELEQFVFERCDKYARKIEGEHEHEFRVHERQK